MLWFFALPCFLALTQGFTFDPFWDYNAFYQVPHDSIYLPSPFAGKIYPPSARQYRHPTRTPKHRRSFPVPEEPPFEIYETYEIYDIPVYPSTSGRKYLRGYSKQPTKKIDVEAERPSFDTDAEADDRIRPDNFAPQENSNTDKESIPSDNIQPVASPETEKGGSEENSTA